MRGERRERMSERDAEEPAAEGGEERESGEAGAAAGPAERAERRRLLARLGADPGLCAACVHLRLLASPRSVFVRCGLAASDPAFPRYPALPVLRCAGFRQAPGPGPGR
jgi:hypothetical protein